MPRGPLVTLDPQQTQQLVESLEKILAKLETIANILDHRLPPPSIRSGRTWPPLTSGRGGGGNLGNPS